MKKEVVRRIAGLAGATIMAVACGPSQAQQGWPLWKAYCNRFLDDQGRVIDRGAHDRTTSEGQAYAMFFALVANDRPRFDKLLRWTTINLAHGDLTLRLPAWLWGQNVYGQWKTLDENSASDADVWIAYSLLQAGRLWHEPRYEQLGKVLAARIAHEEVRQIATVGTVLLPGASGFQLDAQQHILNPSYVPPSVLRGLMRELPQGPWADVLASLPALLSEQAGHGFAMDWVRTGHGGIVAAAPPLAAEGAAEGGQATKAGGSYDAIRVYLWLGIADRQTPGLATLLKLTGGMAEAMRQGVTPPLEVDPQGRILRADAPVGFSAAMVPYLDAHAMGEQAMLQRDRVAATRQPGSGLYGEPAMYYDQNLVLFSTGWSDKRYRFGSDGMLQVNWKSPRLY